MADTDTVFDDKMKEIFRTLQCLHHDRVKDLVGRAFKEEKNKHTERIVKISRVLWRMAPWIAASMTKGVCLSYQTAAEDFLDLVEKMCATNKTQEEFDAEMHRFGTLPEFTLDIDKLDKHIAETYAQREIELGMAAKLDHKVFASLVFQELQSKEFIIAESVVQSVVKRALFKWLYGAPVSKKEESEHLKKCIEDKDLICRKASAQGERMHYRPTTDGICVNCGHPYLGHDSECIETSDIGRNRLGPESKVDTITLELGNIKVKFPRSVILDVMRRDPKDPEKWLKVPIGDTK